MTEAAKQMLRRGVVRLESGDREAAAILHSIARIISANKNHQTNQVDVLIEHMSLDPIPVGDIPPVYTVIMAERGHPHFKKIVQ